jgi:LysR family transcriptional regulator, transcriptional activator of nhaA
VEAERVFPGDAARSQIRQRRSPRFIPISVFYMEQGRLPQASGRPNFNHLLYFWEVARSRSIARTAEELSVSPSTISAQLRALEKALGGELFCRSGRRLVLTDFGKIIFRYSEEIFATSAEMMRVVRDRTESTARPLRVGILDALPKVIVYRILSPTLKTSPDARLSCAEADPLRLLEGLARHDYDLLLSDHPLQGSHGLPTHNHALLGSPCVLMAAPGLANGAGTDFPRNLDEAPFLLPARGSLLRQAVDGWLLDRGIHIRCVAEFEDSALLKQFGRAGEGFFVAPEIARTELESTYGVRTVGPLDGIEQNFFAVTTDRSVDHPLLRALLPR